jgi:hypothetical protein
MTDVDAATNGTIDRVFWPLTMTRGVPSRNRAMWIGGSSPSRRPQAKQADCRAHLHQPECGSLNLQ